MIRARFEVDIHELNGSDTDNRNGKRPQLIIHGHPTMRRYVCLVVGETRVSVDTADLETAITAYVCANAQG